MSAKEMHAENELHNTHDTMKREFTVTQASAPLTRWNTPTDENKQYELKKIMVLVAYMTEIQMFIIIAWWSFLHLDIGCHVVGAGESLA